MASRPFRKVHIVAAITLATIFNLQPVTALSSSSQPSPSLLATSSQLTAYAFNLDTNPGWSCEGQWAFGKPTGQGSWPYDPSSGYTGTNVYGYNLAGDYANLMQPCYLTTTPLDCSNLKNIVLSFRRWLNAESTTYDHAYLMASRDGIVWTNLWDGGGVNDASWIQSSHSLPPDFDGCKTLRIRWSMGPTDYSRTYSGWNIDDIYLSGTYLDDLRISPNLPFSIRAYEGGPFASTQMVYSLYNANETALMWTAQCDVAWADLSPTSGQLPAGSTTQLLILLTSASSNLPVNTYRGLVTIENVTSGTPTCRDLELIVRPSAGTIDIQDSIAPQDDEWMPFGPVLHGNFRQETLVISNSDLLHDLVLTNISGWGEAFSCTHLPDWPRTLRPQESLPLNIRFHATEPGTYTNLLVLSSDDAYHPNINVELSGCITPPIRSTNKLYVSLHGQHRPPFSNWATAATSIQAAVKVALPGDLILVSNGVYDADGAATPDGQLYNRVMVDKPLFIQSVNGAEQTVIVGKRTAASPPTRCLYLGTNAQLAGFTLQGGATMDAGTPLCDTVGGGAFLETGAILSNCFIEENAAYHGGGVYGGMVSHSAITLNTATRGGGAAQSKLRNCLITENSALMQDGSAGALDTELESCTVARNLGGGLFGGRTLNSILYYNIGPNWAEVTNSLSYNCTTPCPIDFLENFESGNWSNWTQTASRVETTTNQQNIIVRDGNEWGHLYHSGPQAIRMTRSFPFDPEMSFGFRMQASQFPFSLTNGNWSCAKVVFDLYGTTTQWLASVTYGRITASYKVPTNAQTAWNHIPSEEPIVYHLSMSNLLRQVFQTKAIDHVSMTFETSASWQSINDQPLIASELWVDDIEIRGTDFRVDFPPQFVDPNAGDYRLSSGSQCINAGFHQTWMTAGRDLDQAERIRYGSVDLGAFENRCAWDCSPFETFVAQGPQQGPFTPSSTMLLLTNLSNESFGWMASTKANWLSIQPAAGILAPGSNQPISVRFNQRAKDLPSGSSVAEILFTSTNEAAESLKRTVQLLITPPDSSSPRDVIYSFNLDQNPGWACDSSWSYRQPQGNNGEPPFAYSGLNAYVLHLYGAPSITNQVTSSLVCGPLNCAEYKDVRVSWKQWEGKKSRDLFYGTSSNGSNLYYTLSINKTAGTWSSIDNKWAFPLHDGATNLHFVWRAVFIPSQFAGDYFNFAIDDVIVTGVFTNDLKEGHFIAQGLEGGPFSPATKSYNLANLTGKSLAWTAQCDVAWAAASPRSGVLAPHRSTNVIVSWTAAASNLSPAIHRGMMTITRQDGHQYSKDLELQLRPVPGVLQVSDSITPNHDGQMPYGLVIQGRSRQETLIISNSDHVHSLIISNISNPGSGFLCANFPALPKTLLPHERMSLNIRFQPQEAGAYSNNLVISSDNFSRPNYAIPLTGIGIYDFLETPTTFNPRGHPGGPFTPPEVSYQLVNRGMDSLAWSVEHVPSWAQITLLSGVVPAGRTGITTITVSPIACTLPIGRYADSIVFSNRNTGILHEEEASLTVFIQPIVGTAPNVFTAVCYRGFSPPPQTLMISNTGDGLLCFNVVANESKRQLSTPTPMRQSIRPPIPDRIVMDYSFERPEVRPLPEGWAVGIHGLEPFVQPGAPIVPAQTVRLLIPPGQKAREVRVTSQSSETMVGSYFLPPAAEPVPLGEAPRPPNKIRDSNIYNKDAAWPSNPAAHTLVNKRGYEYLTLPLFPVQYNPVSGQLIYHSSLRVEVELEASERALTVRSDMDNSPFLKKMDNPSIASTYSSLLDRPPATPLQTASLPAGGPYKYIIITTSDLTNAPAPWNFQALRDYRTDQGLPALIVTTEWIYSQYPQGDHPARVRAFLRDAYVAWGTTYALIGGTHQRIPARYLVSQGTPIPADMYFGCVEPYDCTFDGNHNGSYGEPTDGVNGGEIDFAAEIYMGRAAVNSTREVSDFVRKTITYNHAPPEYRKNISMLGEYLGFSTGGYATDCMEQIRKGGFFDDYYTGGFLTNQHPDLLDFNTTNNLYDAPGFRWSKEAVLQMMNSEAHVLNHFGHAWIDYNMKLYVPDLARMTNTLYFFAYSQGCYSGAMDSTNCFAALITTDEHGAIGAIMNARYGWGDWDGTDGPGQRFARQFWDAILNEELPELGRANQDSKEDNIGGLSDGYNRWICFGLNLFGDPAQPLLLKKSCSWLSLSSREGSILPGANTQVTLDFNADSLLPGAYQGFVEVLATNDPDHLSTRIPLQLQVIDWAPSLTTAPCVQETQGLLTQGGQVSLNQTLNIDLTIALTSSPAYQLRVPSNVCILAGTTNAFFDITIQDNHMAGTNPLSDIIASAALFSSITSHVEVLDDDLHHFDWSPLGSPQVWGASCWVEISARSPTGGVIQDFNQDVQLAVDRAEGHLRVEPNVATGFVNGIWRERVVFRQAGEGVRLTAQNGQVCSTSAVIDVRPATPLFQARVPYALGTSNLLAWIQDATNLLFQIEWNQSPDSSGSQFTTWAPDASVLISGLSTGQLYYYRIQAKADGTLQVLASDWSDWIHYRQLDGDGDWDADAIPDRWEDLYGLNPLSPDDAHEDTDGDGSDNWREYMAGTIPTNQQSDFRWVGVEALEAGIALQWKGGMGITQVLEVSTNLFENSWRSIQTNGAPSSENSSYQPDNNGHTLFYRVRAFREPR